MRGEYHSTTVCQRMKWELPPRARRIQLIQFFLRRPRGTTSAYAENTARLLRLHSRTRNYLRVRGEYCISSCPNPTVMELPPRTRRIRVGFDHALGLGGTTSAYAENTPVPVAKVAADPNYLRVRGEYRYSKPWALLLGELPPRTRRIPPPQSAWSSPPGTTSAYAENTPKPQS